MVEVAIFMKGLGVMILVVLFLGGVGYWMITLIKKANPDFKYWFKYKILRKKYNEQDVAMLLEDLDQGIDEGELFKAIVLSNKTSPDHAKELIYIYKELKRIQLKGGNAK
jgi:hypothetical protein